MENAERAQSSRGPRARFPLLAKLTLWAVLVAALPSAAIGWFLIEQSAAEAERGVKQLQLVLVDDVARTIDANAAGAERDLQAAAEALTDREIGPAARLSLVERLLERGTLDTISVYDDRGQLIDRVVIGAAPPGRPEISASGRAEAERGLAVGAPSELDGGVYEPMTVALRADGVVTGYVGTLRPLAPLADRVQHLADTHLGALSGAVFVLDGGGAVVASSRPEGTPEVSLAPSAGEARAARSGEYESDGTRVLGSALEASTRPWLVVAEVPTEEAYASVVALRRAVVAAVFLAIVVAFLFAFAVARRITAPLRHLTGFAKVLAERRFEERITVRTEDELAILGDAMSGAAAELEASEARIRREAAVRADLGRYLPAELVEGIVARETSVALGGERRQITVLFADVVAFTPLTEQLEPEEVVTVLNELFTVLTEVVFRHQGMIDKFVGDCVMAVWGAIDDEPDHARKALAAAEDMLRWLETANPGWKKRYGVTVQLAIGVNSGEAIVGNVGSEQRMEFTAIGDVVNVAARLETIARPNQILVGERTRDHAGAAFDFASVGKRTGGDDRGIELFEVVL
ncbi:MAG: adenylate/guanylate cyclase domain-containing protein [Myxococcota bacterium]